MKKTVKLSATNLRRLIKEIADTVPTDAFARGEEEFGNEPGPSEFNEHLLQKITEDLESFLLQHVIGNDESDAQLVDMLYHMTQKFARDILDALDDSDAEWD